MEETYDSPRAWERVAAEVKRRRVELGLTQPQVHAAGGPSVSMLSKIEGAKRTSYEDMAIARLEKALQWAPGSIEAIRRGGAPTPLKVEEAPAGAQKSLLGLDEQSPVFRALERYLAARDAEVARRIEERESALARRIEEQSRQIAELTAEVRRLTTNSDDGDTNSGRRETA